VSKQLRASVAQPGQSDCLVSNCPSFQEETIEKRDSNRSRARIPPEAPPQDIPFLKRIARAQIDWTGNSRSTSDLHLITLSRPKKRDF
jgi:hypothetical protein